MRLFINNSFLGYLTLGTCPVGIMDNTTPSSDHCAFCTTQRSQLYKCPRCDVHYCSVECYKSPEHVQCSEAFYRVEVLDELKSRGESLEKRPNFIRDELKRIQENKSEDEYYDSSNDDSSEDNANEEIAEGEDAVACDENYVQLDLSRLDFDSISEADVDRQLEELGLNPKDSSCLINALNEIEKEAFDKIVREQAAVMQEDDYSSHEQVGGTSTEMVSVEEYQPWWIVATRAVVEIEQYKNVFPVSEDILSQIKSVPLPALVSECVKFNFLNILTAYCWCHRQLKLRSGSPSMEEFLQSLIGASQALSNEKRSFVSAPDAIIACLDQSAKVPVAQRSTVLNDLLVFLSPTHQHLVAASDMRLSVYAFADIWLCLRTVHKDAKAKNEKNPLVLTCLKLQKKTEFFIQWIRSSLKNEVLQEFIACLRQLVLECVSQNAEMRTSEKQQNAGLLSIIGNYSLDHGPTIEFANSNSNSRNTLIQELE